MPCTRIFSCERISLKCFEKYMKYPMANKHIFPMNEQKNTSRWYHLVLSNGGSILQYIANETSSKMEKR